MTTFDIPLALALGGAHTLSESWESPGLIAIKLLIILFLVFLNGFFVASEFAIVKVRNSQLETLIEDGNRRARSARHITQHLDAYLSATQLGITLASLALGWLGEAYLAGMISPFFFAAGITSPTVISTSAIIIAFSLITFLHIVIGELAPKSLAIRRPVPTSLWVSRPLRIFYLPFRPIIWVLNGTANWLLLHLLNLSPVSETDLAHSLEELQLIADESHKSDEITPVSKEILINALDMSKRVVRDIMTPRSKVIYLDIDHSFTANIEIAHESRHTRFPLCKSHLDNTLGMIHIKDLFSSVTMRQHDLHAIKRDLLAVSEMMSLEKLLQFFLSKHAHIAIVLDEYGGNIGMVTLDNVLEEIVGDIQDEFDADLPEFVRVNDHEFIVAGGFGLYELEEHCELELESTEVSTIGGYVTHVLGRLPIQGENVEIENYLATITKTDGKSVEQLHFKQIRPGRKELLAQDLSQQEGDKVS